MAQLSKEQRERAEDLIQKKCDAFQEEYDLLCEKHGVQFEGFMSYSEAGIKTMWRYRPYVPETKVTETTKEEIEAELATEQNVVTSDEPLDETDAVVGTNDTDPITGEPVDTSKEAQQDLSNQTE